MKAQNNPWTLALCVALALLLCPALAGAQKKKLSLAELAALEWKLEQSSKALTTNPDPEARRKAVVELQDLADPRAVRPLARALKEDPDAKVRLAAAEALASYKSPEALGLLELASAADPAEEVRAAADRLAKAFPKRLRAAALVLPSRAFRPPPGQVTAKVIGATLKSPSGDARLWAIEKLGVVKVKDSEALLTRHLRADPSSRVRIAAAGLLATLKKKKALPVLITAVSDGDPAVRFELARTLAEFADAGALAVVQKLAAEDANETVRAEAKDLLEPSTPAGQLLLKTRIKKLTSQNPVERIEGLNSLNGLTHWRAMVPMSCTLLGDKIMPVRIAALKILPEMHDTSVLTALRVAAVVEPDPKLLKDIRKSLMGMAKKVTGLIKQLKDPDPLKRTLAARALGQAAYPPGLEPLIEALKDQDNRVRLAAAEGLTNFASEKAKDALKVAGADKSRQVRKVVDHFFKAEARLIKWRAFYKDPKRIVTWTIEEDPIKRADAAFALGVSGASGTDGSMVNLLLKDKDEKVRLAAAWALVLMGTETAENALKMAGKDDKSEKVRLTARKYLVIRKIGRDDLIAQLRDDDPAVRQDAADALSLMANSQVLPHLIRATLCDSDPIVRQAALRGLARVGNPLAKTVIQVTMNRDPDKAVRRTAMIMHILSGG